MENNTEMIEKEKYTAILYVDGSSYPNPGFYGSGIHGYIYNDSDVERKSNDKPNRFIISDQGYLEVEQLPRYIYKTVAPSYYINAAISYSEIGTNNIAELKAIIESLKILSQLDMLFKKIVFKSDSNYVIGILNSIANDTKRSWYSEDRVNIDLWLELEDLYNKYKESNIEIIILKVKGHSTSLGNNIADRLAFLGRYKSSMNKSEIIYNIKEAKQYWKPKIDRHPFINFKHLFFSNEQRKNSIDNLYIVMDYKKDVEVGRKTNEALFGVAKLSEPIIEIENIMDLHNKYMKTLSILSTINLKELYSQKHLLLKEIFGDDIYTINPRNNSMCILEEDVIANNINPPGLATQAMSRTINLYNILSEYETNTTDNKYRQFIDITDYFFKLNNKNKLTCSLKSTEKVVNIDYVIKDKKILVVLELGKDLLDRNSIKKLEKLEPKITLVVDNISPLQIEYYVILETRSNGDKAIYTNYYSNKIFLNKS